jgi:hypothetical protein
VNPYRIKLGLAGTGLVLAALACNFAFSSAKIQNVHLAKDKEGNSATTDFGQEDTIYLLGELSNASSDTQLKTSWLAVDVSGMAANTVIDEANLTAGSGTFSFYLQNNDSLWPPGKYKVDLYMNDELNQSLEYQVEQTVKPEVQNLHLSQQDQGSDASTRFQPEDTWHLVGELINAAAGAKLRAVWSAVNVQGDLQEGVIDEQNQEISNGPFSLAFSGNRSEWPGGSYSVDVYLDGNLIKTIDFQVEAPPEPTQEATPTAGDEAALNDVYLSKGEGDENETRVFAPSDVFYIHFDLVNAPQGAEVEAVWFAVDVPGYDPNESLSDPQPFTLDEGKSYISITNDEGPWTKGEYSVDLKLNGHTVETRDFLVSDIKLLNIYMSYDQNGRQKTTAYGTKQNFYLNISISNAPSEVKITTKWFQLGSTSDENFLLNDGDHSFGSGDYYFSLYWEPDPWIPGDYAVDIYLEDYYYTTVNFKVQ